MPKPENIIDKGFDKHPENINKEGRPKKIYTVIKELGYSADDLKAAFGELGFYTLDQLKDVYNDETKPVIVRIVSNQFFLALKHGDWTKIKDILEHTIGKPKQDITIEPKHQLKRIEVEKIENGENQD